MEVSNQSKISRIVLPASAFALIFIMALVKIGDYDIWYHLKVGEYILSTGSITHLDPFSYTNTELPWPVHSWLFQVIYFKVFDIGGIGGLIIFNAFVICAAFLMVYLVYLTMRLSMREGGVPLAIFILIIAAFAVRFRMWARPHVLEFVFLAGTVYILNLYRGRGCNRLFLLPVIQLVWVNTHGSFVLGLIVTCVYLAGGILNGIIARKAPAQVPVKRFAYAMVLTLVSGITASLINPDTYRAFVSSFSIMSPFMANINEFQPLSLGHL